MLAFIFLIFFFFFILIFSATYLFILVACATHTHTYTACSMLFCECEVSHYVHRKLKNGDEMKHLLNNMNVYIKHANENWKRKEKKTNQPYR